MVEAMIGVVLLVVAMQSVIPLAMSSSQLSSLVTENHLVRAAAREKVDEVRAAGFASIPSQFQGAVFDVDADGDGTNDLTPIAGENNVGSITIQEVAGGNVVGEALHVTVTIRWQSAKGNHQYDLKTIVARD